MAFSTAENLKQPVGDALGSESEREAVFRRERIEKCRMPDGNISVMMSRLAPGTKATMKTDNPDKPRYWLQQVSLRKNDRMPAELQYRDDFESPFQGVPAAASYIGLLALKKFVELNAPEAVRERGIQRTVQVSVSEYAGMRGTKNRTAAGQDLFAAGDALSHMTLTWPENTGDEERMHRIPLLDHYVAVRKKEKPKTPGEAREPSFHHIELTFSPDAIKEVFGGRFSVILPEPLWWINQRHYPHSFPVGYHILRLRHIERGNGRPEPVTLEVTEALRVAGFPEGSDALAKLIEQGRVFAKVQNIMDGLAPTEKRAGLAKPVLARRVGTKEAEDLTPEELKKAKSWAVLKNLLIHFKDLDDPEAFSEEAQELRLNGGTAHAKAKKRGIDRKRQPSPKPLKKKM